jgi:hypothetical protein
MIDSQLTSMGLSLFDYRWLSDRTQKTPDREKRPDECFFPYEIVDDDDWPRLVVETGKTQGTESLEEAARWWLAAGGDLVVCVLLFDIDSTSKTITIQKWENITVRRSSRRSRRANPTVVRRTETAVITESGVTGRINLPFHTLFTRDAQGLEPDLVFDTILHKLWKCF